MVIEQNVDCTDCKSCIQPCKQGFHYQKYTKGKNLHIHTENEYHMVFILSGSVSVSYEEVNDFVCKQHYMLLLLNKFNYHIIMLEDTEMVLLNYAAVIQVCDKLGIDDGNPYLDTIDYKFSSLIMKERMLESIQALAQYLKDGVRCMHLHKAKQIELFVLFIHYYTLEEILYFFFKSIRNDISFYSLVMEKHIYAKNVEDLAELCGYGLSNFKKVFRNNFDQSPYKWMIQQTTKRLRERLLDKTTPLKVIAAEFQFSDQSHLGAFCKQHLGATPLEIREGKKKVKPETSLKLC